jgi:hypothetical protein
MDKKKDNMAKNTGQESGSDDNKSQREDDEENLMDFMTDEEHENFDS